MGVKHIKITVDDETHQELDDVKGDRTWEEAIKDEFGIEP